MEDKYVLIATGSRYEVRCDLDRSAAPLVWRAPDEGVDEWTATPYQRADLYNRAAIELLAEYLGYEVDEFE